jgi:hypothetical protein
VLLDQQAKPAASLPYPESRITSGLALAAGASAAIACLYAITAAVYLAALKCLYLVTRSLDPTGAGRA